MSKNKQHRWRYVKVLSASLLMSLIFNSEHVLAQAETITEESLNQIESVTISEDEGLSAVDITISSAPVTESDETNTDDTSDETDVDEDLSDLSELTTLTETPDSVLIEIPAEKEEETNIVENDLSAETQESELAIVDEDVSDESEFEDFTEEELLNEAVLSNHVELVMNVPVAASLDPTKNTWSYSETDKSWGYYNDLGQLEKVVSENGYYLSGKQQKDSHISINGQSYYYDKNGILVKDKLVFSEGLQAWFQPDKTGLLVKEVTPWGYYLNGAQFFDTLVNVQSQDYYFEPELWGGTMAFNKWSYSPAAEAWYKSSINGQVNTYVTPNEYKVNNTKKKDAHIYVNGSSYYYDNNGKQVRNKEVYSNSMNAWFKADRSGVLTREITPWGHYVNGGQVFDVIATVGDKSYYFEPSDWGGTMSFNKWSYSPTLQSWYFSNKNGTVSTFVTPDKYTLNGVQKKDAHISINGMSFYYDQSGKQLRNKEVFSTGMNAWFKANSTGILISEITPWGRFVNGVQMFDTVASAGGKDYYFEPQAWGGVMAFNKWSFNSINSLWYYSKVDGAIESQVSNNAYFKNGVKQYDSLVDINGLKYYFGTKDLNGDLIKERWAHSISNQKIYYIDKEGLVRLSEDASSANLKKIKVFNEAYKILGIKQYSAEHKQLVNDYNAITPRPVSYMVQYSDDWCDVFTTVMFDRVGLSNLIGRECGVERHINIMKNKGIWNEDGTVVPKAGDIITFHHYATQQPNNGFGHHIGIVEAVVDGKIFTLEGNADKQVKRRVYDLGYRTIRGFGSPKYY